MYVFIMMQKDATPFNVTSVTQEDIVEIFVTLGHTHPLVVLQFLATESLALFDKVKEMQQASCGAIKVMELHDKSITIRTTAPLEPHIRAYITVGGGDPSKP